MLKSHFKMSYASIRTSFDPLCRHNLRHGSGSTGYLRKGSMCTVQDDLRTITDKEDIQSELPLSFTEEILAEVDPSRINYFEVGTIPSTSTYSSPDQYGIPLTEQKLTIDFTPIPGVDDDEMLIKKCNEFWKFIEKNPKLNEFCAMPPSMHSNAVDEEEKSMESFESNEQQATCWLENNENKLRDSFVSRIEKQCEPLPSDYKYGPETEETEERSGKVLDMDWLRRGQSVVGRRCLVDKTERVIEQFSVPDSSAAGVLKLCHEMEKWDLTHAKRMVSPGPPPPLAHAVLQKKR